MFKENKHNEETGWDIITIVAGVILTLTLCAPWIIFLAANM